MPENICRIAGRAVLLTAIAGLAVALPASVAMADRPGPGSHDKHHGWNRPDARHGHGAPGTPCPQPTPRPEAFWSRPTRTQAAAPPPPAQTHAAQRSETQPAQAPPQHEAALTKPPAAPPVATAATEVATTAPTPEPTPTRPPHLAVDLPTAGPGTVPAGLLPLAGLAALAVLIAVGFRVRQQVARVD